MSKRKDNLRSGYTTGSCAAAVARAAAIALLEQTMIEEVVIALPDGQRVKFKLNDCAFDIREASCSVIKDAGDDPDITDGAEVRAAVCWKDEPGVAIEGGEGVGMVTKPGLDVPIGKPAINNVPLMMIEQNVAEVIGNDKGLRVVVSVPEGKELAKKTLNKRLGIIGGISILGTSGVVIPYSIDAYQASISQALDIAVASGYSEAVLTTGRRSEKYAQREFPFAEEAFVLMGDFVGYALRQCASREIKKVIIWGMIGKLSKIANKDFYTNISDSKIDMDFLAGVATSRGVAEPKVAAAREAVTAHHFLKIVGEDKSREVCDELCFLASRSSRQYVDAAFEVECVMSTYDGTILGRGSDKG